MGEPRQQPSAAVGEPGPQASRAVEKRARTAATAAASSPIPTPEEGGPEQPSGRDEAQPSTGEAEPPHPGRDLGSSPGQDGKGVQANADAERPERRPRIRTAPRKRAPKAGRGTGPRAHVARPAVRVPSARVALSTSSVYPESVAAAFEIARKLGYDGVELMVFTDSVSQDVDAIRGLVDYYEVPVLSVHSPCLLVTQRVWSTDPWVKLQRSQEAAERLGAATVVVHPPFRWQRDYGREFERGLARMRDETDVVFAVENMYPWRAANREWAAYAPDWDPRNQDYPQVTLDLSHTSVSGTPAMDMAADLGKRLTHVHLADGTGLARDEHLVPGRGSQPCAELLEQLASTGFAGTVVLEVSTRKAANRAEREADLAEALAFARLHLAAPLFPAPA